eukprot:7388852-Prymnesium_polylepis.1
MWGHHLLLVQSAAQGRVQSHSVTCGQAWGHVRAPAACAERGPGSRAPQASPRAALPRARPPPWCAPRLERERAA